jgi:hypothetical protein
MAKPLPPSSIQEFLPHEIGELRKDIEALPRSVRDRLLPLCDKICHFIHLQGRLFEMAQETADRLHLDLKYLMFDLDMTKLERDELQQELKNYTGGEEV